MGENKIRVSLPELGLIAGTRGMLGAGIAMLLADRLNRDQQKAVGWTLFVVGLLTTFPLGYEVLSRRRIGAEERKAEFQTIQAA